jgi:hypothetical protein
MWKQSFMGHTVSAEAKTFSHGIWKIEARHGCPTTQLTSQHKWLSLSTTNLQ